MLTHIHPNPSGLPLASLLGLQHSNPPVLSPVARQIQEAAKCPELLCRVPAFPEPGRSLRPSQKALPFLHRSYELMRQSRLLSALSLSAYTPSLCRLLSVPAGTGTFPTLSSARLSLHAWTPTPAVYKVLLTCSSLAPSALSIYSLDRLPAMIREHHFDTEPNFGAAVIHSCSGLQVCSPRWWLPLL